MGDITVIPAPAKRSGFDTGNMLNFLLNLASVKDRQEYTKLQKRQQAFTEKIEPYKAETNRMLATAQRESAEAQTTRAGTERMAFDAEAQQRSLKEYLATQREARLKELKRLADNEKQYNKDGATTMNELYKSIRKLNMDNPDAFDALLFNEEITSMQTKQLKEYAAQNYTSKMMIEQMGNAAALDRQVRTVASQQLQGLAGSGSPEDVAAAATAINSGDWQGWGTLHQKLLTQQQEYKMGPRGDFKPSKMEYWQALTTYGPMTYQRMLEAERTGSPYMEIRSVYAPKILGKDVSKQMDRVEAEQQNVLKEWEASTPIDYNKVKPKPEKQTNAETKPTTKSSSKYSYTRDVIPGTDITIGELIGETVKSEARKTTPSKASKKTETKTEETPLRERRVKVKAPNGDIGTIPLKDLKKALAEGYTRVVD